LEELQKPIYPSEQLAIDKPFILKKLGFTEKEFQDYLESPTVDHAVYGTYNRMSEDYPLLKLFVPIKKLILGR